MKKHKIISIIFIISSLIFVYSCKNNSKSKLNEIVEKETLKTSESDAIHDFFLKTNYINQAEIPSIVKAQNLSENLDSYILIDIRSSDDYKKGHINGAINVQIKEIFNYIIKKTNVVTKKIAIIDYSGHQAAYIASMFRMAGYGNIFGLKFGMASWNKNYADIWTKNISDKYSSKIETKVNNKIKKSTSFPEIKTGKISTYEILKARIEKEIISEFLINADDIFQNSEKYYIINYWPEDIYLKGHIPGAVNYIPKTSLGIDQNLSSLPTNKPIVIYCFSGNTASFVAAYLRVLGYDAYALSYGVNGFMRNSMKSIGIENHIFDPNSEVNNFPLTVGDKPSIESETNLEIKQTNTNSSNEVKSNNSKPVKKKEKKQGGGC